MQAFPTQMLDSTPHFRPLLLTCLCGLLLVGCSGFGDDESSSPEPVRAEQMGERIAIQNRGRDTVWTFVAGRRILARLFWRPSLKQEGLAPGSTRTVALEAIPMDEEEEQLVVFWWHARTEGGQREPGDISSLDVML